MADDEKTGLLPKEDSTNSKISQRALTNRQRLAYGVGHVLNDLTASMWFSYLLIFLHEVANFDNFLAGNLILIGQVADGLFTPFVGFESDRTKKGFCNLGKRKSWHFVGSACVLASFPFIFSLCIDCSDAPSYAQFVYYSPFIVIFQFGWASSQISHLSYSSELTPHKHERVTLQSIRNFFTVFANVCVFGIFTLLFYMEPKTASSDNHEPPKVNEWLKSGSSASNDTGDLTSADAPTFQHLAFICLGIGVVFYVFFYAGTAGAVKQNDNEDVCEQKPQCIGTVESGEAMSSIELSTIKHSLMTWRDWLKEHQFYQVAVLYMCTRLYINISQVYFGIYLTETLKLDKIYIAILPLFSYAASFVTSIIAPFVNRLLGRKMTFVVGVMFGISSCVWMYFIPVRSQQVYGSAIFLGVAGSILLITSLSMTSDLIAHNTESGAFVFGAMSFCDKLSNGLAVFLVQKFHPCQGCCPACQPFYRNIQSILPGVALCLAFVFLLTLWPQKIGVREKKKQMQHMKDASATSDRNGTVQCADGQFYTPPNSSVHCTANSRSGVITHFPEIHAGEGGCCNDDDDEVCPPLNQEKPGKEIN